MAVFPAKVIAFNCKQNMFSLSKQKPKSRNFVRFGNNFETFLSNDLVLKRLTQTIENGNQLFSSLIGCEEEEDNDSLDFEGFEDNIKESFKKSLKVNKRLKNEEKSCDKTEEELSQCKNNNNNNNNNNNGIIIDTNLTSIETDFREAEKEKEPKKKLKTNENKKKKTEVIKRELNHYADVMARDSGSPNSGNDEIANKIQKLLKSQWEERLKLFNSEQQQQDDTFVSKNKTILRKARLQLNKKTLLKIREPESFQHLFTTNTTTINEPEQEKSDFLEKLLEMPKIPENNKKSNKSGQPGFITCTICNATKYYSHVQRRYGVFSCEPCSKFFARFIKDPKQYYCSNSGDCPIVVTCVSRCKACWLKVCLQKFSIDSQLRQQLIANDFSPKLTNQPNVSLITVDTSGGTQVPNNMTEVTNNTTTCLTERLLMVAEKKRIGPRVKRVCRSAGIVKRPPLATFATTTIQEDEDNDELPVDVYLCRVYENQINEHNNTTIVDNNNKKTPPKKYRCKECSGCRADDCGHCNYCRDKKKFGGLNVIKQACKYRTCVRFINEDQLINGGTGQQILKSSDRHESCHKSRHLRST